MTRGRPKNEEHLARRREEILRKAAEVFAKKGFQKTDLQVVADALRIGKGTVYRYFPSKEGLFLAAVDRVIQALLENMGREAGRHEDPIDQIAAAARAYLRFFDRYPEYVELLMQERAAFRDRKHPTYFSYKDANRREWGNFFRELIRAGHIRDIRIDAILDGLADFLYGTIFANRFSGRAEPLEEQVERVVDLMFNGILTDSERKRRARRKG